MSLRQLPKAVKEIRLHLCQSGASSAGVRYVHFFNGDSRVSSRNLLDVIGLDGEKTSRERFSGWERFAKLLRVL